MSKQWRKNTCGSILFCLNYPLRQLANKRLPHNFALFFRIFIESTVFKNYTKLFNFFPFLPSQLAQLWFYVEADYLGPSWTLLNYPFGIDQFECVAYGLLLRFQTWLNSCQTYLIWFLPKNLSELVLRMHFWKKIIKR